MNCISDLEDLLKLVKKTNFQKCFNNIRKFSRLNSVRNSLKQHKTSPKIIHHEKELLKNINNFFSKNPLEHFSNKKTNEDDLDESFENLSPSDKRQPFRNQLPTLFDKQLDAKGIYSSEKKINSIQDLDVSGSLELELRSALTKHNSSKNNNISPTEKLTISKMEILKKLPLDQKEVTKRSSGGGVPVWSKERGSTGSYRNTGKSIQMEAPQIVNPKEFMNKIVSSKKSYSQSKHLWNYLSLLTNVCYM